MKKQVPNKRQTPGQILRKQQVHWQQTHWGINPSPEFGQDKAWVREGREPSWSKDREHLMRTFNKNVENQSFSKKDFSYLISIGNFHPSHPNWSQRRDRWKKEYAATGLGSASRAMRLLPVAISDTKTQKDYIAAVKDTDIYKGYQWGVPSLDKERGGRASEREPRRESNWRASSIPNIMNLPTRTSINRLSRTDQARGEFEEAPVIGELILDHNRNKSLDTPAVKREMAHYDQLHALLKKQDAGVRALVNVFHGGFLGR